MKSLIRLFICSIALNALAFVAFAGPESLPSGKEMKEVAPTPPACPSWAGLYIGGFAGYNYGVIDSDLDLSGLWDGPVGDFVKSHEIRDLDSSGAELGGVIGYNFEWNKWVVGLEASGSYLWLRNSSNTGEFDGPGGQYVVSNSFKTHYLFTLGPRVGYAFCRWLPYVTGGLAVGDLDFSQRFFSSDFFGHLHDSTSDSNAGWFVGGGLQYAITSHWSARVQYQYTDLGDTSFTYSVFNPDYINKGAASLNEHSVSAAIIFQF